MVQELKRIPYGVASFETFRERGYAYVDKTRFIKTLEDDDTPYPFIVRPRRFGKSVFANMLMAYYDKAAKDDFSKNFAETWIGEHPTLLASKFLVIKFDFSGIDGGSELVSNFIANIKEALSDFVLRYFNENSHIQNIINKQYTSPSALLTDFLTVVHRNTRDKIYIIIDEYDQFAQEVLSNDPEQFVNMTGAEGFLKNFYTNIKRQIQSKIIERIFITGVTSISLDSMTSGFNIATNISNDPDFSGVMGFTDEEVYNLIPQIVDIESYGHPVDEIFDRMKVLYDGYRFCPDSDVTVFNSSMCLYYLRNIAKRNKEPVALVDPATSIDLTKIEGILSLGKHEFVDEIVMSVLFDKYIEIEALSETINLNAAKKLSDKDVLTTLFFMGFLTFSGDDPSRLVCPNITVKEVFFKYWFRRFSKDNDLIFPATSRQKMMESLAKGEIRPFLDFVSNRLKVCVGTHVHTHLNETAIQLAVCMAAITSQNYSVTAEEEALGAGFTDLILRPDEKHPNAAGWVIEFKYLKKSEATQEAVDTKIAEAEEQLKRYSSAENITNIPNLRRAAVVFSGTDLKGLKVF